MYRAPSRAVPGLSLLLPRGTSQPCPPPADLGQAAAALVQTAATGANGLPANMLAPLRQIRRATCEVQPDGKKPLRLKVWAWVGRSVHRPDGPLQSLPARRHAVAGSQRGELNTAHGMERCQVAMNTSDRGRKSTLGHGAYQKFRYRRL